MRCSRRGAVGREARMRRGVWILGWVLAACGGAKPAPDAAPKSIAWRHDDYAGALAAARTTGRPIVIDLWAPWCHTCLSMQQTVLVDPAITLLADRFEWLALDTDRPQNAEAVKKLPIDFWPTFFVIDPKDETVQARHVGAATVDQFREFLKRGEAGVLDARAQSGALDDLLRAVRDGDRATQADDAVAADEAYGRAMAQAPAGWPRAPEVLVAWIGAKRERKDFEGCLQLAETRLEEAFRGHTGSGPDFAAFAQDCVGELPPERGRPFLEKAVAAIDATAADPAAPLSVDDRSEALRIAREMYKALGDEDTAKARAVTQRDLLKQAYAEADSPLAASTYNWPRAEVHVFLGDGESLVGDLERNAASLPDQYDPPYRLAWVLLKLNRLPEAQVAAEKALALAYGPRKGRVFKLLADVHAAREARAEQRAALVGWADHERALPEEMRSEKRLADAEAALAQLDAPAAAP